MSDRELRALVPTSPPARVATESAWQRCVAAFAAITAGTHASHAVQQTTTTGPPGYLARLTAEQLGRVLDRATFVQGVLAVAAAEEWSAFVALAARAPRTRRWTPPLFAGLTDQCLVELGSLVAARHDTDAPAALARVIAALLGDACTEQELSRARALARRPKASGYLSHDLHVYKAKFFPRMARAALNLALGAQPAASALVLDPFAGSGTALLEAARLGLPSFGGDIDPLSVRIARCKLLLPRLDPAALRAPDEAGCFERRAAENGAPRLVLPPWLARKLTPEQSGPLLDDVSGLAGAVAALEPSPEREAAWICLSDALTRKLRMRFLGIGVGRFALELARPSVRALFLRRYRALRAEATMYHHLTRCYGADLAGHADVALGDARALPLSDGSVAAALTSPPYLPASSGRENYLLSKAPSLLLLGLLDATRLRELDRQATGSMGAVGLGSKTVAADEPAVMLSTAERRLVEWLAADPLRAIKAEPVRRYLLELRTALLELRRVLRPGARAAVVVGTRSTFYRYATREPLYTVETADMLAAAAVELGFAMDEVIEVELDKANRNARPRSLDTYSESIVLLRA